MLCGQKYKWDNGRCYIIPFQWFTIHTVHLFTASSRAPLFILKVSTWQLSGIIVLFAFPHRTRRHMLFQGAAEQISLLLWKYSKWEKSNGCMCVCVTEKVCVAYNCAYKCSHFFFFFFFHECPLLVKGLPVLRMFAVWPSGKPHTHTDTHKHTHALSHTLHSCVCKPTHLKLLSFSIVSTCLSLMSMMELF